MLALGGRVCDTLMRVMGRHRLCRLAQAGGDNVAGAVSALFVELDAAEWLQPADALDTYPEAELSGCRLRIPLRDRHVVILVVNCVAGIVLIEFAGHVGGHA